jgi:hypothetical protein
MIRPLMFGSRRLPASRCLAWIIAIGAVIYGAQTVQAETRVALVIGNGQYRSVPALANPPSDAKDVAAELESVGFKVTLGVDLDLAGMQRAIAEFSKAADNADVSLVYYGGHGVQVAGHNYLIPVDAKLHDEQDIRKQTIHFDDVLKTLAGDKGIHLLFLDACRTNPMKDTPASMRSQGLARVGDAAGFLITFATQPDNVAFDGAGRNSPFAQALLSHLATAGQDISSMMIEVRKDVIATTGGAQIPWDNSSLTRQFYFAPGEAFQVPPETALWQLGAGQKDANFLKIYLDRYPEGAHVADAKALLDEIAKKGGVPAPPTNETVNEEELLWRVAKGERQQLLFEDYVARYPNGAHRQEADAVLSRFQETQVADAAPEIVCQRLATHPRDATADFPGTELQTLARNADRAIEACHDAVSKHPGEAHYVALQARATAASGHLDEAIKLYKTAADGGDARALVSLGLLYESGNGVPKDVKMADDLYAKAADRGSLDGKTNLANALIYGTGVERDMARALELLKSASADGSALATYNLGALALAGGAARANEALEQFRHAAVLGDPRGYRAAAALLNDGFGMPKDSPGAADELLRAVASDDGAMAGELTSTASLWSHDTMKAVQDRLKSVGYYTGPLDGKAGAALAPALKQWRLLGPPAKVATKDVQLKRLPPR